MSKCEFNDGKVTSSCPTISSARAMKNYKSVLGTGIAAEAIETVYCNTLPEYCPTRGFLLANGNKPIGDVIAETKSKSFQK